MKRILTTAIAIILMACSPIGQGNTGIYSHKDDWKISKVEYGQASWYARKCNGGTKTASGIPLNDDAATAAHKTLPMGTKVKVINLNNNKSEIVKITDRGPYAKGRVIDVTAGVAKRIGFHKNGVAKVKLEVLKK
jgi:rare lipoprotein A